MNGFIGNKRYNNYSDYLSKIFGGRIQKIPINAGLSCPTRDGSISFGGCTYCNNDSFNPYYGQEEKVVKDQIKEGIRFFSNKYNVEQFLAYFQAYTNTYGDFKIIKKQYEIALEHPSINGLIIGTRPDCISDYMLDYLKELSKEKYVAVEYGIESTHNSVLENIKRGHTFEDSIKAITETANRDIITGAHVILCLPGETEQMMLESAHKLSELPITTLKIHQLQIVKGTIMAKQYKDDPSFVNLPNVDEYINLLVKFLERLRSNIYIERFISETPPNLLIAPKWGGLRLKDIIEKLDKKLLEKNTWQGKIYKD